MKKIFFSFLFMLVCSMAQAQSHTISGHITDKSTGESLIGATLYDASTQSGVAANAYGFYSLKLDDGKHELECSLVGYEKKTVEIELFENKVIDIQLSASSVNLQEVVIKGETSKQEMNEFNAEVITMNSIRQLPAIFGEADVIKAVQMQSGVKSIGDGSSGMLVRGGSNDQNLILIDEAPIYNASHLFGMISIFNPDAVNHVTLYKSNMPAQYGGRVSSVLDCMMKEGNSYRHDFSASLSPFAATLTANGPMVKEKASYLVSVRRSFLNFFMSTEKEGAIVPTFYDINAKINTRIGEKDRIFASFYHGNDVIESFNGLYNTWGNTSGTLRWNHVFGARWFMNTSFVVSDYQNDLKYTEKKREHRWHTGISDLNLKTDLCYYIAPECELHIGAGSILHDFTPGESDSIELSLPRVKAFEHAAYILNDWKPLSWLGLNYGLRVSAFQPLDIEEKLQVCYEPRISANFRINSDASLKLAYARNAQYLQVLQNSSVTYTALETWFPAVNGLKPVQNDVLSAGWFQNLGDKYSMSAEVYYKKGQNQIDYVDHAQLINNPNVIDEVLSGSSEAYGLELNASKNIGKITGTVSYTYSRVKYQIAGINNGEAYPAVSDMPHDFRITGRYAFNDKWDLCASWQYASGRPFTMPVGFYYFVNQVVPIYTDRNGARTPAYHRMDISCGYTSPKHANGFCWTANFGLFNAYNHRNPIGYQFSVSNNESHSIRADAYSLFGILPNLSVKMMW